MPGNIKLKGKRETNSLKSFESKFETTLVWGKIS